jgi:hypothetical protein
MERAAFILHSLLAELTKVFQIFTLPDSITVRELSVFRRGEGQARAGGVKGARLCNHLRIGFCLSGHPLPAPQTFTFRSVLSIIVIPVHESFVIIEEHIKEGLSRAYVQAIASRAGFNISHSELDYGVDGTISQIQIINKRRVESGFRLDYQLKASTRWSIEGNDIIYDLEAKTYNDLAIRNKAARAIPLLLILLCLPQNALDWLETTEEQMLLRRSCYWTIMAGDRTDNVRQIRIRIPRAQLLTPDSLRTLLEHVERGETL